MAVQDIIVMMSGVVPVNKAQSKKLILKQQQLPSYCILLIIRASSPKSPNQNWDSGWGYQSDHRSYQSDSRDFISSEATSPVGGSQKQSSSKKEKKSSKEDKKPNNWDSKWGDDELWESINK